MNDRMFCSRTPAWAWMRAVGLVWAASLAQTGAAHAAARPPARPAPVTDAPASAEPANAATIYDAAGNEFLALDAALFTAAAAGEDPIAAYVATGVPSELASRWLESARRLGADLVRASDLRYERHIEAQDGFALGPAHLAPLRASNRALRVLVQDAAMRGDRVALAGLLRAQVTLAVRSAGDGTFPSSIAAITTAEAHMRSVAELLDRGVIDAAMAQTIIDLRAPLEEIRDFGTVAALSTELAGLQADIDRVMLIPEDQRSTTTAALRVASPIALEDRTLLAARQGAELYLAEASRAFALRDPVAARSGVAVLQNRLADGEFGELLKLIAPQLLPTVDSLAQAREGVMLQATELESIAAAKTHPAVHADAGRFYMRAARAATEMPHADQAVIEAILAPESAGLAPNAIAARDAIEANRAAVIEPLILAAVTSRCSLPAATNAGGGSGLVRSAALGLHGAVRVMLADAFGPGPRPDDAPTRATATLAALRVALNLAGLGSYSHSLVAQQIMRDLRAPLEDLASRGELTAEVRTEIRTLLDDMPTRDPLGFERAFAGECEWLAGQTIVEHGTARAVFEIDQLRGLRPNELAFLLAMCTRGCDVPFDAPAGGPLDGALVDLRQWFNLAAFKRAVLQFPEVEGRARRATHEARGQGFGANDAALAADATAVAFLDVTVPIDIEERTRNSRDDVDAIRAIIERHGLDGIKRTAQAR